jgi:hypothetical protein
MVKTIRRCMHADCLVRALMALVICGATVAGAGCGGERAAGSGANNEPGRARSIATGGVSLDLPQGWDGYATQIGRDQPTAVIWAASTAISERSSRPGFPHQTLAKLPEDGIAVEIVPQPAQVGSASSPLIIPPLVLADGYFLADGYEGQPAPQVSTEIIDVRLGDRALYVQVFFGRTHPDEAMRSRANRVLASLTVAGLQPTETRADGFIRFDEPAVGISGRYPVGWHRAGALTNLVSPREVLALATYPLRGGAEAGECAPDTARADMPPGGTFIWLLEYRPLRGDVWSDLPRDRFPPKRHFEIRRADLKDENVSCFLGPAYLTTFRDADRPFQMLVAFGGRPRDEQLRQVDAILDSLRFEELPSPPPDPYAGWPSVNDNPGDSLRPPPGWSAAAAMFPPEKTPRPRPLFFASNRPLSGLPQKLVPYVDELPGPFPARALASFPPDGVLVWALEEQKGGPSAQFPQIGRVWPARADFEQAEAPATSPGVRWLRAGGSFRGYRFSVWVATGLEANDADLALALKSAESLAVSGCWRERFDDCPDG